MWSYLASWTFLLELEIGEQKDRWCFVVACLPRYHKFFHPRRPHDESLSLLFRRLANNFLLVSTILELTNYTKTHLQKAVRVTFSMRAFCLVLGLLLTMSLPLAQACRRHQPSSSVVSNKDIWQYPQWSYHHDKSESILAIRGGGGRIKDNDEKGLHLESPKQLEKVKIAVASVAIVMALSFAWVFRETLSRIFNKQRVQDKTLEILRRLDQLPKLQSYSIYMFGMALWEACGLATIPVETAAGMIFGWKGFVLSATGKVIGAASAFVVGRHSFLASWVKAKLSQNKFLQLVEESADHHPLKTAILMKLSCFPETIKNYGLAVLFPVRLWMFTVVTMVHGGTFSALWTYLGVDTAKRLANPDLNLPADNVLRILLLLSLINGVAISPLAMGYWVRELQDTGKAHDYK